MKLSDIAPSRTHRVCVYGGPKSGKTKLAGALAERFNILYFSLENGHTVMQQFPIDWQERIEIIQIPDTKSYPIAIETMLKVVKGTPTAICVQHGKVDCALCKKDSLPFEHVELNALGEDTIVVVDSLTQLANSTMSNITKSKPDDYKPEWPDYRSQGQLMDKFLSEIQQAKYNVVCITHEVETELEDGKKKLVPVAGTTSFSRNTGRYFDHIIYAELKNKLHNFASSTTYSASVLTGSRSGISIEKETVPSLLSIFTGAGRSKTSEETQVQREALSKIAGVKQ